MRLRMSKYHALSLEYKTKNGNYPVKLACREAVDRFSKYHTQSGRGYHMHHTVPFYAIMYCWVNYGTVPVSYLPTNKRYVFPDKLAKDFTRYHDDVVGTYGGIVKMSVAEHRQLHKELRKNGGEERLISYRINILFERPA